MERHDSGFTVIEVTLFLGFTAMLFIITLLGTGAFVREARYGDSMRRLESFLQSQYSEVVSGVNPRPDTVGCNPAGNVTTGSPTVPGTSDKCLLMGKLIVFTADSDTVDTYYILGIEPVSPPDPAVTPVSAIIESYNPKIVDTVGKESFESPWGMVFKDGSKSINPRNADAIAFIRSPNSSQVVTYVFDIKSDGWFAGGNGPTEASQVPRTTGATANFCFESPDNNKVAAITLAVGQGSSVISTKYDTTVALSCQ